MIERPEDLSVDWLAAALPTVGRITDFSYQRIGTGQMSECYRIALSYVDGPTAGPASVVLKVAAGDPTSRQTGLTLGLYEREVRFYTEIAPHLPGLVARCHHAAFDPQTGIFDLLLDDVAPAEPGNEIRGATIDQAMLVATELGRIHRALQNRPDLADADWLTQKMPVSQGLLEALYAGFRDRYADRMTDDQTRVCDRLVASFDEFSADESARTGLVHGDFRLDNMLFDRTGAVRPLTVVDWQTVSWGPAFTDLAYFVGCALPAESRRANIDGIVAAYLAALGPEPGITEAEVREGIRRQSFFGVVMSLASPIMVERTERGDEMFMTMLDRQCAQVLDTDALALLPRPRRPEPLRPAESDEAAHAGPTDALWNESWYFDFVDPARGLGGWVRLGFYPNENRVWINALLCGPGLPTMALNDFHTALPESPHDVRGDGVTVRHEAVDPLRTYRVSVHGTAQAYDDPAALLRGESGRPVSVAMELVWDTVGTPYQYRMTTRYEIPCTVTGTVRVEGEHHRIDTAPGQRDHSWGVRDWWGMDWVWSALHLDDGTHAHGVEIRIPGAPQIGIGYLQRHGAPLIELQQVTAREEFASNGLPVSTELTLRPTDRCSTPGSLPTHRCGWSPTTGGSHTSLEPGCRYARPTVGRVSAGWSGTATSRTDGGPARIPGRDTRRPPSHRHRVSGGSGYAGRLRWTGPAVPPRMCLARRDRRWQVLCRSRLEWSPGRWGPRCSPGVHSGGIPSASKSC